MNARITVSRMVGLVLVIAALSSGSALAVGNTPEGQKADGLRLQGLADRYVQMRGYTQEGLTADGLRYQAMARAYQGPPAASFYTPRALRAEGLRWQRMAEAYAEPQVIRQSGFDWSAAGIGALGVFVAMLCGAVLIFGVRRIRQEKLAV